jgi:hypothetical protein
MLNLGSSDDADTCTTTLRLFEDVAQLAVGNENSLQMTLGPNGGLHFEAWLGGESEIRITSSSSTRSIFSSAWKLIFWTADDPLG